MSPLSWPAELLDQIMSALRSKHSSRRTGTVVALLTVVGIVLGVARIDEVLALAVLVLAYGLTWLPTVKWHKR